MTSDSDIEKEKAIKCLRLLRNLLTDDIDLKSPIHDERFLIRFVRAKKYDANLAHQSVRKYFRIRRKFKDVWENAYPNYGPIKEFLEANVIVKLKHNDPEGRPILLMNSRNWDLERFNDFDLVMITMALHLDELPEAAQTKGVVFLNDKDQFTFNHGKLYNLGKLRIILQMYQGAMPIRFKSFMVLRANKVTETIFAMAKPFMTEKFKSRVQLFGTNLDDFVKTFGADKLPQAIGGNLTDEEAFDLKFRNRLFERNAYYRELSDYGFGEGCSDDEDTYL
jgi:hypothetical protein